MAARNSTKYKKVFITGANGFIGRKLGERYRADGAEICGIDFKADADRGVVVGDLEQVSKWEQHLEGCDLVIHTAAVVSNVASTELAWRVNVKGTNDLLKAAAAHGVKRFLHLSSVAAFGFKSPENVAEDYPLKANGNPYVDTKICSEHAALMAHASGLIDCTIIRPADVYGPGSRPWVIEPLEMLKAGKFLLPANGQSSFSPVYIDDVLDGIQVAASKAAGAGQIFTLGGGIVVTCEVFFDNHNRWLGNNSHVKSVPTVVAKVAAELVGNATRLLGKHSELGAATVDMLNREHGYSIEKAQQILGWEPKVSLEEGMRLSHEWAKAEGLC
jgi:nucleoside-diphosphate-sugar epimerase